MSLNASRDLVGVERAKSTVRLTVALFWPLWLKHRAELLGIALLIIATRVSSFVPQPFVSIAMGVSSLGLGITCLLFMARLANGDSPSSLGDDKGFGSAYPIFMLTLPVSDRAMVYVPMLFGAICSALLFALAGVVYWPEFPLVGVELSFVVTCSVTISLQGLAWSKFRPRYVKPWLVCVLILWFVPLYILSSVYQLGPAVMFSVYVGFSGLSLLLSPIGFGHARHASGSRADSYEREKPINIAKVVERPAFASRARTLDWMLWKRHGQFLPIVGLGWCVVFLIVGTVIRTREAMGGDHPQGVTSNVLTFFDYMIVAAFLVGAIPRKSDLFRSDFFLHPFTSTRPLSGANFIGSIIRTSLIGSFLTAIATAGAMVTSACVLQVNPGPSAQDFLDKVTSSPIPYPLACLFSFFLMWLLIWNAQTLLFAWEIAGRRLVVYTALLLFTAVGAYVWMSTNANDSWVRSHAVPIAWSLVALKITTTVTSAFTLKAKEWIPMKAVAGGVVAWIGAALLIWKVFPIIFTNLVDDYSYHHPIDPALWLPIVILITPLARFFVAPITFEWNRHR